MHEMSIAEALLNQVRRHTPEQHHATVVRVEAGSCQAVNPRALQRAWRAMTVDTELAHSRLEYKALPFAFVCGDCGRRWATRNAYELCTCGAKVPCAGTSELRLVSLEVERVEFSYSA